LPENLKKPYGRIALKDMTDDDFEAFITETTAEVDAVVADFAAKGSVMRIPLGGGKTGKEPSKEDTAEALKAILPS
jgi:hypothetical protein